ncbi:TetR/AcrR family transcriptional regulator [Nocardioides cavernaquae]|uniref:TetR/AcrR family transcriptional regulator n=1 Tax=Nocardioides cavernaquae TaxID=2321396 RepID=A0A3A5H569_9ACTN|nr:TetR family transcriptional regulator [Nocardioides cavernaquae]RJS45843.1 TetR/AcrR family transcriptional regulator [Nocardioides cavernaquae]
MTVGIAETATIRDRIVVAATEVTTTQGWSSVTMSRLADAVGVSRQTVYNEIGTKTALAEAMILGELARFLERVDGAFLAHPEDIFTAIRAAVTGVLDLAEGNALIKAIVSATHGADTELLPLLTTHSGTLMETAKLVIGEHLAAFALDLEDWQLDGVIDAIVRVVLSHVMQPSGNAEAVADTITWIASRVLGSV